MSSRESREMLANAKKTLLAPRAQQKPVPVSVDHIHVACDGCRGSGRSHEKRSDGKALPCKTCGGPGSMPLHELQKRNPESASRLRKLHTPPR